MSGTPFSEYWYQGYAWTPFNRGYYREGTSGNTLRQIRTPFLWFADFYVEYSLKLGKTSLNFNVNVENAFNLDTANSLYQWRDYGGFWVSDEESLANNWDLEDRGDLILDPRFGMESSFYSPIAARLGVRFSF